MVLHDFECGAGHLFERAVETSALRSQRCPMCKKKADVVYLPKRHSRLPNTVYYMNAKGEKLWPWTSGDLPKAYTQMGFQRQEVGTFERGRFEQQVRREMNVAAQRRRNEDQLAYEEQRDHNHAELRHESRGWDQFHQDLASEAIRQELSGYSSGYDSEFHIGQD